MTEDFLSPAALEDEAHHRAKLKLPALRQRRPCEWHHLRASSSARSSRRRLRSVRLSPMLSAKQSPMSGRRTAIKYAQLDRRLTALEARPTLAVRGVWKPRASYEPGDAVSDKSALWVCTSAVTGERPGASSCWRLAVKAGEVPA